MTIGYEMTEVISLPKFLSKTQLETLSVNDLEEICAARGLQIPPTETDEQKKEVMLKYLKYWILLSIERKAEPQALVFYSATIN